MIEQLKNWFDRTLAESDLTQEEFLWGTMVVALLCASTHLLTMLITRWGDSRATSKSWVFSALLHVGSVVGLVIFTPPADRSSQIKPKSEPVYIRGVIFEDAEPEPKPDEVWDRVKPRELNEVARSEQEERNPFQPAEPDRTHEENIRKLEELVEQLQTEPDPVELSAPDGVAAGQTEELADTFLSDQVIPEFLPRDDVPLPDKVDRTRAASIARGERSEAEVERSRRSEAYSESQPVELSRNVNAIEALENPEALLREAPTEDSRTYVDRPSLAEPEGAVATTSSPSDASTSGSEFSRTRPEGGRTRASADVGRGNTNKVDQPLGSDNSLLNRNTPLLSDSTLPQPSLAAAAPVALEKIAPQPKNYQLRNLAKRRDTAKENGGTEESEQAVERSLAWLAKVQHPSGYWDADRHGAGQVGSVDLQDEGNKLHAENLSGRQADTGLTSLAVLAFLGAGYTHEDGQYRDNVEKALRWIISQQDEQGYLGGNARHFEMMYCHGMATYALAEAYGMRENLNGDSWLRKPIEKGVQYVISQQNPKDGGWRYLRGQESDMSMFGWQLMALKSAEISGIAIPDDVKFRMIRFLKDRSRGDNQGLASYVPRQRPSNSMTAEALFCKQILGIDRTNPACVEAVEYMLNNLPSRREYNLYYWYYGTLAMYQHGGTAWNEWNGSLRDRIVAEQRRTGEFAGSWDPRSMWSPYGGRIYSTALSTLCLEVYYRFLPLYRMEESDEPSVAPGQ